MSYLMHQQRGYEHSSPHPDEHRPHMASASFTDYPDHPYNSTPNQHDDAHLPLVDHSPPVLPKVGGTRCYWSLLSADLHFIYTDPVLTSHLGEQADRLVGLSLLSFVHPDEQASAKQDLGSVLESRTLHGSVTRARFCRLSKVRRDLGYEGTGPLWADGDKIAVDSNYMAVDIVINWAAEGLVLCFLHAVVDLSPQDNDEENKTGWTNWCGTTGMTMDQVQLLFRRLLVCIPQSGCVTRVFQILGSSSGRPLLLSWPPDNGNRQGPLGRDFAKLVEDVQIDARTHGRSEAKTSCTRRYKALQSMSGVVGQVESVFIPHGTIIFACHKFDLPNRPTSDAASTMPHMGYGQNYVQQSSHQPYYEQSGPYDLPPSSAPYNSYLSHPPQQVAQYSPPHWSQGGEPSASQHQYHSWNSPSPAQSSSSLPLTVSNLRSGSYPPPPQQQNQQWPATSSSYMETDSATSHGSPGYSYSATDSNDGAAPGTPTDAVPPPRRRVSPGNNRDQYSGGRGAGNRPAGVLKCSSCKATQSPEWRKGPSGKKELCNACGLRYARSRAKKEGHAISSQRRRKDKGSAAAKRESATPPVASSRSYSSSFRRGGYDNSFSAGSTSGSEVYSQSGPHALDTLTPSPSPPASSVNFVHYSPEGRQPYNNSTGPFYSVPSPLSNPSVIGSQHGSHLDHMPGYSERLSPMLPSASPVSHSPLTSTTAPASFERDREKDRELPPTPVSAEPRQPSRRSALAHERRQV